MVTFINKKKLHLILTRIISYGTSYRTDANIRRVRVANLVATIAITLTIIYSLGHIIIMKSIYMALGGAGFVLIYLSYFFILHNGHVRTAKTTLISISMVQLLIFPTIFFSTDGGHHFYFLIAGALAFLIFEPDDHVHKIILSIVSLLCFFICEWWSEAILFYPVNLSARSYQLLFCTNIIMTVTVLLGIMQYFNRQIHENDKKLEILAKTDPLTGLLNRRELYKITRTELKLSKRHQHHLSVLLFDIDHFKNINDTYGHDTGDRILVRLSEATRQTVRSTDTIARYGGEEFVLILPKTTTEQAYIVAEKLRTRVETLKVTTNDGRTVTCTVSIGIAGCTPKTQDVDALIKQADLGLYKAKNEGRNRTKVTK